MSTVRPPIPLPDPPLATGSLVLRPWTVDDAPALVAAWADPDVGRWTGVPARCDEAAARRWITGEEDRRARGLALDLVIEVDGEVVGEVGLADIDPEPGTAEIGWWVAPSHRGNGLASEAANLVAEWAVEELCIETVLARCQRGEPRVGARGAGGGLRPGPGRGARGALAVRLRRSATIGA